MILYNFKSSKHERRAFWKNYIENMKLQYYTLTLTVGKSIMKKTKDDGRHLYVYRIFRFLPCAEGYKIWFFCTIIMCLLILKFQYSSMFEILNDDSDYPDDDEFDDEEPDDEAGEKQANDEPVVEAQASR